MMVSISTFAFSLIHRYKFSPGVECEVLAESGWRSLLGTISARCGNPPWKWLDVVDGMTIDNALKVLIYVLDFKYNHRKINSWHNCLQYSQWQWWLLPIWPPSLSTSPRATFQAQHMSTAERRLDAWNSRPYWGKVFQYDILIYMIYIWYIDIYAILREGVLIWYPSVKVVGRVRFGGTTGNGSLLWSVFCNKKLQKGWGVPH